MLSINQIGLELFGIELYVIITRVLMKLFKSKISILSMTVVYS